MRRRPVITAAGSKRLALPLALECNPSQGISTKPAMKAPAIDASVFSAYSRPNGAISRAELGDKVPRWVEHFAAIDADGNGELGAEELKAHRQAMRAKHRAERAQREG